MKEEGSLRDLFLDRPAYALVMIIGLLFVSIITINRLLVRYAIVRQNLTPEGEALIDRLFTAKVVSQLYAYLLIDGMLVGLLIRSIIRLVEPERPLGIGASMGISFLSALAMFLVSEIPSLSILFLSGKVYVDMQNILTGEEFANALEEAFSSRSAAHPIASKLIVFFHYLGIATFLAFIRYLVNRKYGYKTATITTTLIFSFFLIAFIRGDEDAKRDLGVY